VSNFWRSWKRFATSPSCPVLKRGPSTTSSGPCKVCALVVPAVQSYDAGRRFWFATSSLSDQRGKSGILQRLNAGGVFRRLNSSWAPNSVAVGVFIRPRSTRGGGNEKGAKCEARSGHIFCWPLPPQLLQVRIIHLVPVPSQEVHRSDRSAVPQTGQRSFSFAMYDFIAVLSPSLRSSIQA
jgi:hypothetical protein